MKTISLGIANYCAPCHARCRYCLLSSCGGVSGVGYDEGLSFAARVLGELSDVRPDLSCFFYIGYCMDVSDIGAYIRFCREHHSPGARFLQMNGFGFRSDGELTRLMERIHDEGVETIDLSFYGTESRHDAFAGRKGDYAFLKRMIRAANRVGLPVNVSIPLIRDNLCNMAGLREELSRYEVAKYLYFLPHSKGRGRSMRAQRITRAEFEALPEELRRSFVKTKHITEAEWLLSGELKTPEKRNLTLVLNGENLAAFRQMSADEILSYLEALDDRYIALMPSLSELALRYGNPANQQLYRLRDLALEWQQRFIAESGNTIYDMHDETHHFSVHYYEE